MKHKGKQGKGKGFSGNMADMLRQAFYPTEAEFMVKLAIECAKPLDKRKRRGYKGRELEDSGAWESGQC